MENQISTPTQYPKKNNWFGKIETQVEALEVIKASSGIFYFVAILQIVIGYFFVGTEVIASGVIFGLLAFLLHKFNSIVVAIILLLLSVGVVVVSGINILGYGAGWSKIIIPFIMIFFSVRAIHAAVKLYKLDKL